MFAETHDPHPELTLAPTPDCWAAFEAEMEAAPEVGSAVLGLARPGHQAVKKALSQRGVRESGGENAGVPHQRYVRYFNPAHPPLPWCAFFVSWCFDTTGDRDRRLPWANPGYVGSIRSWARSGGHIVRSPEHGDIFGIGDQHTGLVAGANPRKRIIWTIEGNWGDAVSQRNLGADGLWFARLGA